MQIIAKNLLITLLVALGASALFVIFNSSKTLALSGSDFNPGRIIDDVVFYNSATMSATQIQQFLNSKVPVCDTNGTQAYGGTTRAAYGTSRGYPPPYTCLKDYSMSVPAITNSGSDLCKGSIAAGTKSAAQIIYDVAQACGINPQVLIVLLQKEQSLITDDWPWGIQYRSATGYGCPDTAPCDAEFYGFFNQVYQAAKAFRRYEANPTWYNYRANRNNFIYYHPSLGACGGTNVFIQNQATASLYIYTPYQPNAAALNNLYGTGDGCSAYGNRNFWRMFRDWFGSNLSASVIKSASTDTIYLIIEGTAFIVPAMAILQDYGFSPNTITTVSQSAVDSMRLGSEEGFSTSIGHLVKSNNDSDADGGSIYLISVGKRYQITSMTQFNNFGFSESSIRYLPLSYISKIPSGGSLQNFVRSPNGAVFEVGNNSKRLIYEYQMFKSRQPSGVATSFSYFLVDRIPSGNPLTNRPILTKFKNSSLVYLYLPEQSYHPIPSFNTFQCWEFTSPIYAVYAPPQNNYVSTVTAEEPLSCIVKGTATKTTYVVENGSLLSVPNSFNIFGSESHNSKIHTAAELLLRRNGQLSPYIKSKEGPAVWTIENGSKRLIPSYASFKIFVPQNNLLTELESQVVSKIPTSGIKLADGTLVKSSNDSAVYAISNNQRLLYNFELFNGYGNKWDEIETYSSSDLSSSYPYSGVRIKSYYHESTTNNLYLIGQSGCYLLPANVQSSLEITASSVGTAQGYDRTAVPSLDLTKCLQTLSLFIKTPSSSAVYRVEGGEKRLIPSWSTLVTLAGTNSPNVSVVDSSFISTIPTGISY